MAPPNRILKLQQCMQIKWVAISKLVLIVNQSGIPDKFCTIKKHGQFNRNNTVDN